ncbi:MAG: tetratricopeptide repeat protein [bacterium]
MLTMTPEAQVAKIISYVDEPPSQPRAALSKSMKAVITNLMRTTNNLQLRPWLISRQLGFALVAVLGLSVSAFWGVRFCKTTLRIMIAERILKNNYHIYMAETPRLSGGYASTGIQVLMGPEKGDAEGSYLEEARTRIAAAMASGSKAAKAMLLLAQIAIIERDYDRADSILHAIVPQPSSSAAVLNDLGVLRFERNDWDGAVRYFEAAIRADAKLKEARYNFALAKGRIGANEEAIQALNECVKIEHDEGWKNAALVLKQGLQEDKDE